jgi:hypothetical protein
LEHFWCTNELWANTDSQDSPWPRLGGSHHLPHYSILYAWPRGLHQMSFCPKTPKLGVLKFLKLGLLRLWRPIIFCVDLQLRWSMKKSCSPLRDLSKDMWHATCIQVIQGDYGLLVVGSQIGSLTLDLSFGHNLCFMYPKWVMRAHFKHLCFKSFQMI